MRSRLAISILLCFLAASGCSADQLLISPSPCVDGLSAQPNDGPFAVYIFCDDALGVNIGFVLTEQGAGANFMRRFGASLWTDWGLTNRFWQDPEWAAGVNSIAWSPSGRYAFISTDEVTGEAGFYRLDLPKRSSRRLNPERGKGPARVPRIIEVRPKTNEIVVETESMGRTEISEWELEPKS